MPTASTGEATPLYPYDPPKIGDFWLDARIDSMPGGTAYLGHHEDAKVIVVQLSEGPAAEKAARDRFSGLVNRMHIDDVVARGGQEQAEGRLGRKFRPEQDAPVAPGDQPMAPWVALAFDGTPAAPRAAHRLLAGVDLTELSQQGRPAGPDYHQYWIDRLRPGLTRVWPLPWPGRHDRAGWLTILFSWLIMIAITVIAIAVAIFAFRHFPPEAPPPPVPTSGSGSASPQSASASASTASASPSSATPSPSSASASPTPSNSGSPTPTPSGSPTPTPSGSPTPTPGGSATASASSTPTQSGSGSPTPTPTPGAPSPGATGPEGNSQTPRSKL